MCRQTAMARESVNTRLSRGMATGGALSLCDGEVLKRPTQSVRICCTVCAAAVLTTFWCRTVRRNHDSIIQGLRNVLWLAIRMTAKDCLRMQSNVLFRGRLVGRRLPLGMLTLPCGMFTSEEAGMRYLAKKRKSHPPTARNVVSLA